MRVNIEWSKLFPTRWSPIVFVSYMALFIAQGIFVTASQSTGSSYAYNTVTVVLFTEMLKLIVSICLFVKDNSLRKLHKEIKSGVKVLLLYFFPALLYCIYNNLAFINLSVFDPTTYYLLLQFRVVLTGIIFQVLFKQRLSRKQWLSLILLTLGCVIKQIDISNITYNSINNKTNSSFNINVAFIFVQVFCSCVAGVSNEKIIKDLGANVNIFIHNIFMCTESIFCNVGILFLQGSFFTIFSANDLCAMLSLNVILVIVVNAAIGITTSLFLKHLNAILKTFASALEIMFTAVFCWVIFGIPIHSNTIIAIFLVTYSTFLYSKNPVVSTFVENQQTTLSVISQSKGKFSFSLKMV